MRRFNLKQFASICFLVLIIVIIGYYVKVHWQDFQSIRIVSCWALTGLVILTPIYFGITSLFFQKSLEPFKLRISFNQYFGLTMITLMGNYLIPFSGFGFRAVYMKKIYSFSYRDFLTTVIASWITNFLIYTLAGMVALIVYYFRTHKIEWTLFLIFLIVLIISCLSFIPLKKNNTQNKILISIASSLALWQEYIKNKDILKKLFVLTFYQFIVTALMFYFAYLTFGFKITFIDSFLPTTLSLYSSVIRLVPASLGFYEAAVVYPSKVMGLSIAQGLLVSTLTRVVTMFWTFALGLIFSYILVRKNPEVK